MIDALDRPLGLDDGGDGVTAQEQHETVEDSPVGWVASHIRRYVQTDGADGGTFHGVPSLLLTTRGRRSGTLRIQVGAERIVGRARTATGAERVRLWPVMTKVFPTYARYAKETDREIPVIVIERID